MKRLIVTNDLDAGKKLLWGMVGASDVYMTKSIPFYEVALYRGDTYRLCYLEAESLLHATHGSTFDEVYITEDVTDDVLFKSWEFLGPCMASNASRGRVFFCKGETVSEIESQ